MSFDFHNVNRQVEKQKQSTENAGFATLLGSFGNRVDAEYPGRRMQIRDAH